MEENKQSFITRLGEVKTKTITIIGIVLVILMILLGTLFIKLMKENNKCQGNPLIYAANKVSEESEVEMTCSCSFSDPEYSNFYFNKEGIVVDKSSWIMPD